MARDLASVVFGHLMEYQTDAMQAIRKSYDWSDDKIRKVLDSYPGKAKYHGHGSGGSGDALAPEAEANQKAALKFLRENVPAKDVSTDEKKKGVDKVKEKSSKDHTQEGLTILKENSGNLGVARQKLSDWDKDWESNRLLFREYERVRAIKKASHASQQ